MDGRSENTRVLKFSLRPHLHAVDLSKRVARKKEGLDPSEYGNELDLWLMISDVDILGVGVEGGGRTFQLNRTSFLISSSKFRAMILFIKRYLLAILFICIPLNHEYYERIREREKETSRMFIKL